MLLKVCVERWRLCRRCWCPKRVSHPILTKWSVPLQKQEFGRGVSLGITSGRKSWPGDSSLCGKHWIPCEARGRFSGPCVRVSNLALRVQNIRSRVQMHRCTKQRRTSRLRKNQFHGGPELNRFTLASERGKAFLRTFCMKRPVL